MMKCAISVVFVVLFAATLFSGCGTTEPTTEPTIEPPAEPPAESTAELTTENAAGGIQIAEWVTYVEDFEPEGDPPAAFPPQDAAKALYEQALVNLFDESDYGEDSPIVISWVGLFDVEGSGECYLFNVRDYENSFAVSYAGEVYEILFGKGIRAWGQAGEPQKPQTESEFRAEAVPDLVMDVAGMEYTGPGVKGEGGYWLEESVYFQLATYYPFEDRPAYDETSMLNRIKALMGGDIELRTLGLSDEHGARLGVPVWRIVYDSGKDADLRRCTDLYFSGDLGEHFKFGEYWVHTEIAADAPDDKYHDEIERRLATVALLPPLAIDTAGLESINPLETEWTDGTLYIGIQSFVAADGVLDEAGVVERVKSLNGRESPFELIAVNDLGKNSELQTSHLWKIEYFSGGNEDTNRCADLYFRTDYHEGRTDYGEYWLHTSVDGDFELSDGADEYDVAGAIGRIFESAKLETSYTDMLYLATDYPYDD